MREGEFPAIKFPPGRANIERKKKRSCRLTTTSTTATERRRLRLSSRINPGFLFLFFDLALFALVTTRTTGKSLPFRDFLPRDPRTLRYLPLDFATLRGSRQATPMSLHRSLSRSSTRTASAPFSYIYAHSTALGSRPAYTFLFGDARRGSPKYGERFPARESTTTSSDRSGRKAENLFSRARRVGRRQWHTTVLHVLRTRTICRRHDASDAWRRDAHPRSRPGARRREATRARANAIVDRS